MPANLTPQYMAAEKVYREAKSGEERIAALEEMLRIIPKHKGTEKLQADLKRRLSKLRQAGRQKFHGTRASHRIPRQGAGQAVLLGAPNVGKSALLAAVTQARPEVGPSAFTTHKPTPGMMDFEDVQIQIIDLPPMACEYIEPWVFDIIRGADLFLILTDLTAVDPLGQVDLVCEQLEAKRMLPHGVFEPASSAPPDSPLSGVSKPTLLIGTKLDGSKAEDNAAFLREYYAERFPCLFLCAPDQINLDAFRQTVFTALDVLRVYTKLPGKKAARGAPYVLPRGATVMDVAIMVHKEVAEKLKFAKIWGAHTFDGQKVHRDYVVRDGDLLELHILGS